MSVFYWLSLVVGGVGLLGSWSLHGVRIDAVARSIEKEKKLKSVLPGIWYSLYTELAEINTYDKRKLHLFCWVKQHPLTTSWDNTVPALPIEGFNELCQLAFSSNSIEKPLLPYLLIESI